jgi:hypothetical protein
VCLLFLGTDYIVFVAEDLLFCLKELEIGGSALRHLMVIFYFEFACHFITIIIIAAFMSELAKRDGYARRVAKARFSIFGIALGRGKGLALRLILFGIYCEMTFKDSRVDIYGRYLATSVGLPLPLLLSSCP